MKGGVFTIKVTHGKDVGRYRMVGNSLEQAFDRANVAFKNEFGTFGKPQLEMEQHEDKNKANKTSARRR